MIKQNILILTTALVLAGCVTTQEYSRPGATESQKQQDTRECEYDVAKATAGVPAGFERGWDSAQLFKQCMKARGYE